MVRTGQKERYYEITQHAKKYLSPHMETQSREIHQAAGLLAFPCDTNTDPYKVRFIPFKGTFERIFRSNIMFQSTQSMYSLKRWDFLSDLFIRTHHELLSLPPRPLLHIALSAGLSALKTPSCHSSSNSLSAATPVCPICSTELNELARKVPYAHHTKSYVENDPIILPSGRIYGRERLLEMGKKLGFIAEGKVKDPATGDVLEESEMKKVYIM
jgi:macrophage erythroblast attacher